MLAIATAVVALSAAYAPPRPILPSSVALRHGQPAAIFPNDHGATTGVRAAVDEHGLLRARMARTAATALISMPAAVLAAPEDYISKEEEDQEVLVLVIITLIVLISPTVGIQMARGAISNMAEEDDDRFRGNTDPLWSVSPDAQRKKKQAEAISNTKKQKQIKKTR